MPGTIPAQVQKYFWGDDLAQLNGQDHQQYITQTLLERGGKQSINWLFNQVSRQDVRQMLPLPRLYQKLTWNQAKQEMTTVIKETRFK